MTRNELIDLYVERTTSFQAQLKITQKNINIISNLRLVLALVIIGFIYLGFKSPVYLYALPLLIVIFIFLVRKHAILFKEKTRLSNLIQVQNNELQSLDGDISCFHSGREFVNPEHPYTHDLDIFGAGSLFQFINRINTYSGKQLLAERLSKPLATVELIRSYQEGVKELASKTIFRHEVQAAGMQVKEDESDTNQLLAWVKRPPFIYKNKFYRVMLVALPVLTLLAMLLMLFVDGAGRVFWLLALAQLVMVGTKVKLVSLFHDDISRKKYILQKYADLLKVITKEKFSSEILNNFQRQTGDAEKEIGKLAGLVSTFNARGSIMIFFANALVMFDFQCVWLLEKWKDKNGESLKQWLDAVHEIEMLCSLGTFSFNNNEFNFPAINSSMVLSATRIGHPLIDRTVRVENDIQLDTEKSILIITGANMAGKSTFLRTLGVNVVLALCGAPVCAQQFNCPLIEMRSGMRTADSLKDHQSYFYAELNRLKSIVDDLKTGKPLFILLDEILKGTNSTDKQYGSIALVKQLVCYNSLALIATHDLALGELASEYPEKVRNFCFEPFIENDQLSFDYLLKPGLAQKMNATFLMKKMGIIP